MTVSINGRYSHNYKDGVLVKETLNPANETVARGHYAATTLSAVDADLATANIKNGITLFGFAGSANVFDISDATAVEGEVLAPETFYAVGGGIRTGTMPTQTLNPANENVLAGYYAATTLSAVDAQLAAANILSGVNIFGFVGVATVQDIADADALVGDVKDPKTFYSVTGARKTGTMPTVALAPGSSAYPAGYHAGDVGGLPAIDADLATGNIKSGITIFNVAGHNDVRDISDADLVEAEAPTGKFFYAVSGGRRTGSGTKTLSDANDTVAAGYYAATTLSAVDGNLAPANIKEAVNIFGKVGTVAEQGTETYERYHTAEMATETTYTPGDSGMFCATTYDTDFAVELQDGASTWQAVLASSMGCNAIIGDGSHLRFYNSDALTKKLVVMRHYFSTGTYERYYTAEMAASATYTPSDEGFFGHGADIKKCYAEFQYNGGDWLRIDTYDTTGTRLCIMTGIGDGTNLRFRNQDAANARWIVAMRAVMT